MDHANEDWIKVYTRDTAAWRCTSLAARGLSLELSRNMRRFTDTIHLGPRGLKAVAALVGAPWAEVEPLLEELLADGRLVYDPGAQTLRDPEHAARQTARTSAAQRKRDSRRAGSDVTRGHAPSPPVTPGHDQREENEETEESETRAPEDVADAPEAGDPDQPPALDEPLTPELRELGADIVRSKGVVDVDVETSWRNYVAWLHDEKQPVTAGRWIRWMNRDCSEAAQARKRQTEREWSRPRLIGERRSLFAPPDTPPAPYHLPAADRTDDEPAASRELALEAASRLAAVVSR